MQFIGRTDEIGYRRVRWNSVESIQSVQIDNQRQRVIPFDSSDGRLRTVAFNCSLVLLYTPIIIVNHFQLFQFSSLSPSTETSRTIDNIRFFPHANSFSLLFIQKRSVFIYSGYNLIITYSENLFLHISKPQFSPRPSVFPSIRITVTPLTASSPSRNSTFLYVAK